MIMCINPISNFSFSSVSKAFTAPDNVTDIQGGQHASQTPIYLKPKAKRFLERWLSLTQDYAKPQSQFSRLRTSNWRLQNTIEPLQRDTVLITQNVTQSNE